MPFDGLDHLPGIFFGKGSQSELDILERLDKNPAETEHDGRRQPFISFGTDDNLLTFFEIRLEDKAWVFFGECLGHGLESGSQFVFILEVQGDAAGLGFMDDGFCIHLQDKRKTKLLGGCFEFILLLYPRCLDRGEAVTAENLEDFCLRQEHLFSSVAADDVFGFRLIDLKTLVLRSLFLDYLAVSRQR